MLFVRGNVHKAVICAALTLSLSTAYAGPDVIVGDLDGVSHYGPVGTLHGYAVGTVSCNVGDENLLWIAGNNQHPVIGQNLYRLENGRLEMLGQSWLKHGFTALTQNLCDTCSGQGGAVLGVGCSDPYSSGLNGGQTRLGPRSEVNALTGAYTYPYILNWQATGNATFKRIQVEESELSAALHPSAIFFVEGQYVTPDDAGFGNGYNNASYRRVTLTGSLNLNVTGTTFREKPAIFAWLEHGLGVGVPDPDVNLISVDDPEGGRFWVASKVTDLGGDNYHYEYAIFNLNSDRSAGAFMVPLALGGNETNVGFRDVDYHSGEPYTNTDWNVTLNPTTLKWETEKHMMNPNANALRWGTMYNFRFDSDAPPLATQATIELFKPGVGGNMIMVDVVAPDVRDCNTNGIPDDEDLVNGTPDCNGNGSPDICDMVSGFSTDCNTNTNPDECDIDSGASFDVDTDTIADECDNCVGLTNSGQEEWLFNTAEVGNAGEYNSLVFDAANRASASYYRTSSKNLKYWNDSNSDHIPQSGEIKLIDNNGDVGQYSSLAFDAADRAAISYYNNTTQALQFWHDDNGNGLSEVAEIRVIDNIGNTGRYTSLKYDNNGFATVAYYSRASRVLKLWHDANGNNAADGGEVVTIDNTAFVGEYAAMVFDSLNRATVAYHEETNGGLRLWHDANGNFANDAGEIRLIDVPANLVGRFASIAIDSTDRVAVSHYDATAQDVKMWRDTNGNFAFDAGENFIVEGGGAVGQYTSTTFDDQDRVIVGYYRVGNQNAVLWFDADGDYVWQASERFVIAETGDVGKYMSVAIHPVWKTPVVAYRDETNSSFVVGIGLDWDADGTCFLADNCPTVANSDQADTDGDGSGDACDPCPTRQLGDVSGDNNIDALDAPGFVSLLLNPGSGTADEICAADVNADGVVDGLDVNLFVEMILAP